MLYMSWVFLVFFSFPWTRNNKSVFHDFFLFQARTKVLCRAAMEVGHGEVFCLESLFQRQGQQRLCHTSSRARTTGTSTEGSCYYFEMVWGFLLCQTPRWGGNWRCIVETSTGAQEMTSLQELVITVREFALDFYFKVLWGIPQAWISVCLGLSSAYRFIW